MRVVYLPQTYEDVRWINRYYTDVFPAGRANFRTIFYEVEKLLQQNPEIGKKSELADNVRELNLVKTPFVFIYRVKTDRVEVLRIWDQRRDRDSFDV